MPTTSVPRLSSRRFHYSEKDRTFTAEISDLQLARVPAEIQVVSARTGKAETFIAKKVDRDAEGEVLCWVYESENRTLGLKVVIFND